MMKTLSLEEKDIRTLVDSLNIAGGAGALPPGLKEPGAFARIMVTLEGALADEPSCSNPSHGPSCCRRAA